MKTLRSQAGLSYVEVLVATTILVLALTPMLDALYSGLQGGELHARQVRAQSLLVGKMEQTLTQPFADLLAQADAVADPAIAIPAPWSDAAGSPLRRLLFLSRYDGDNADGDNNAYTGTEADLLWIRVEIENTGLALETLRAEHE